MVNKFVTMSTDDFYERMVVQVANYFSLKKMIKKTRTFFYPEAFHAPDFVCQQSHMVCSTVKKTKFYLSDNCHLFNFKTKVSILLIDLSNNHAIFYPRATADVAIFRVN